MQTGKKPIVLMYHRVAHVACDPWNLAVTPERFEIQVSQLRTNRDVVPLSWLGRRLQESNLPDGVAAITFDDGYADVLHNAKPVLEKLNVPATLFIVAGAIGDDHGFWWDVLSRIILECPELPDHVAIKLANQRYEWRLAPSLDGPVPPGALSRSQFLFEIHKHLRVLDYERLTAVMNFVKEWAATNGEVRASDGSLSPAELLSLAECELVEIGAHTITHPSLPALDREAMRREIEGSLAGCSALAGTEVKGFSYPFGDFNEAAVRVVQEAGFEYACTTEARTVDPESNVFLIPRVYVGNWDEAEFSRKVMCYG